MTHLNSSILGTAWVVLIAAILGATGCDTWKRADGRAGRALAMHVSTREVGNRELISIQSRRAAVLIDPAGARVVDYHLGRRPRWILEVDPQSPDGQKVRQLETPTRPNVLVAPGWVTKCDGGDPALDHNTYWQVDATTNRVVLLSDAVGGLRWRKTFYVDEFSGELFIDVSLENTSFHSMKVSVSSLVATRGKLKREGETQRAWADGVWFGRRLVSGPPFQPLINGPVHEDLFEFGEQAISPGKKITWRERWWLAADTTGTRPAEPPQPHLRNGAPVSQPSGAEDW